jgi:Toastrack DUF4097
VKRVGELASAPVEPRAEVTGRRLHASPWSLLVAVSLLVLVGCTAAFGTSWLLSARTKTVSFGVRGELMGVQVRVAAGDVVVLGGAQGGVAVRRSDRSTFGRSPVEWRRRAAGRLTIASACPKLVLGSCWASYRIAVPDNVPISVRSDRGSIRVEGYRGSASLTTGDGSIVVDAFCGFTLRATSTRGDIAAAASCAPERLDLRSTTGDITARVPAGRYRIDASTGRGAALVRGLTADQGSPWEIHALSTSGDVTLAAGS